MVTAAAGAMWASTNIGILKWPKVGLKEISLRHWNFSKWLVGSAIIAWASSNIFYLGAGAMIGTSAIGILKSTQNTMAITHILFQGLQSILPIRASRAYNKGGIRQLIKFVRNATLLLTSITGIVSVIVCIYADRIMELLYGPEFKNYGWVLVAWAVIYILVAMTQVIPIGLLTLEKTFPIILSYACSTVISIAIFFPLIKRYELTGVIVGTAIVYAIQFLIPFMALKRLVRTELARENKTGRLNGVSA